MTKALDCLNTILWGAPALVLILGVGLYLTFRLGFAQITLFPRALRAFAARFRSRKDAEGVSPFRALCTALAATVGTGNLVGVAGAICLGGPGAIFWMWLCAGLGMVTKFAEATLAVRFRVREDNGFVGGPMYVITRGMGARCRPLAYLYCICGVIAAFGIGTMTQVNSVITGIHALQDRFGIFCTPLGDLLMGIGLAALIGMLLFGGAASIGQWAERLVPFAAGAYILLCAGVLAVKWQQIPGAFSSIVLGAFSPRAITGGMIGSAFRALRVGCARGVFTNEAGMGTASIAHACAQVDHPVQQGCMGILEVFLDTIVICTLTALVILVSGVSIPYGVDAGAELTLRAFSAVYGSFALYFLTAAMALFAIATVLGWGLYGARCVQFLFGSGSWRVFAWIQTGTVVLSTVIKTATVWQLSETVNGLMVIPNLIALAALTPEVSRLTKEYKKSGASLRRR